MVYINLCQFFSLTPFDNEQTGEPVSTYELVKFGLNEAITLVKIPLSFTGLMIIVGPSDKFGDKFVATLFGSSAAPSQLVVSWKIALNLKMTLGFLRDGNNAPNIDAYVKCDLIFRSCN